jgi:hypothetical protein
VCVIWRKGDDRLRSGKLLARYAEHVRTFSNSHLQDIWTWTELHEMTAQIWAVMLRRTQLSNVPQCKTSIYWEGPKIYVRGKAVRNEQEKTGAY